MAEDEAHAHQVADSYKREIFGDDLNPCIEVDGAVVKVEDLAHRMGRRVHPTVATATPAGRLAGAQQLCSVRSASNERRVRRGRLRCRQRNK